MLLIKLQKIILPEQKIYLFPENDFENGLTFLWSEIPLHYFELDIFVRSIYTCGDILMIGFE